MDKEYKIYTSYYKNEAFLKSNNIVMVGVSRFPPENIKYNILELAPSAELLMKYKENPRWEWYYGTYLCQLRNTNICSYMNKLDAISKENNGKDIALCCYEFPDEHCHRHIISDFFNDLGLEKNMHEFTGKDVKKKDNSVELF